ncbi:MAG: hypothetical protein IKK43_04975 [Clostridia bacterium]|nr:hypothetical protein [Clostridia bacterium]
MTGNKAMNFNEMDDFELGVSLYESEMETEINDQQRHMQRCILKGKRAKRVKNQKILWWRKHHFEQRYDPNSMNLRKYTAELAHIKSRNDTLVFSKAIKGMPADMYDDINIMPVKYRRYNE